MTINILAVGDVTGQAGLEFLTNKLAGVKKWGDIAFTVANGENAAGLGLTVNQAQSIFDAGVDVITLGNHTWGKQGIHHFLNSCDNILRPSNFAPTSPGKGWGVYDTPYGNISVINLVGRAMMHEYYENPFFEVDRILKKTGTSIVLVDFHAEATSEKYAMAYHLDGRVSALWGTHTHVQTSDCRVFPGGTGYITDLGMTGPHDSIIGMKPDQPLARFLGNPPGRFEQATGPAKIEGAIFTIDTGSGKCEGVEALRVM